MQTAWWRHRTELSSLLFMEMKLELSRTSTFKTSWEEGTKWAEGTPLVNAQRVGTRHEGQSWSFRQTWDLWRSNIPWHRVWIGRALGGLKKGVTQSMPYKGIRCAYRSYHDLTKICKQHCGKHIGEGKYYGINTDFSFKTMFGNSYQGNSPNFLLKYPWSHRKSKIHLKPVSTMSRSRKMGNNSKMGGAGLSSMSLEAYSQPKTESWKAIR